MLSTEYQFLFIHVPKTAGNSVHRALLPFSDDHMVSLNAKQDKIQRFEIRSPNLPIEKHSTLSDYRAQLPRKQFEALLKISCIRNPWDRCVSFFFSPHRGIVEYSPEAFEAFIDHIVAPSHQYLKLSDDDADPFNNIDFTLRFEHLEKDFALLCEHLGLPPIPLPRVNVSSREEYRYYYKAQNTRDLVAQKFALEIERFGYSFTKE